MIYNMTFFMHAESEVYNKNCHHFRILVKLDEVIVMRRGRS